MGNSGNTTEILSEFSEEDLHNELKRRELEEEQEAWQKRRAMLEKVIVHRDTLLAFVPHSRSSCGADELTSNAGFHPEHGGAYCPRCCLLSLQEHHDDIEISVTVQMSVVNPKGRG